MKKLRYITILVLMQFTQLLNAQTKYSNLLVFSPYITNDLGNNQFPLDFYNGKDYGYGSSYYFSPINAIFSKWQLNIKYKTIIEKNWCVVGQFGISSDKYESTLYYGTYNKDEVWRQYKNLENINGNNLELGYGIGKIFYLDKKQKISIIPELLLNGEYSFYNKEIAYDNTYNYNGTSKYKGSNIAIGGQMNLNIYYQIYKQIGVGISYNKLISAMHYENTSDDYRLPKTEKNNIEFGNKLNLLRFNIVVYY
ncbi:MAG: hypothetical protein ACOYMA_13660 [Bacteroidia bacterium]